MGILSGNPKDNPLHYGEIFDIWLCSTTAKGSISVFRALKYHAGDSDLKEVIGEIINQAELEVSECDTLLHHNGIAPIANPPERPEAKLEEIPVGARLTDMEIAPIIAANIAAGLVACSQAMGKSIREDVGVLFEKYHTKKAALGMKVLRLSKEKGWLMPPPLQIQRPDLVNA
ncbi:hypothetical protein D3C80_1615560 [compost metagenome]